MWPLTFCPLGKPCFAANFTAAILEKKNGYARTEFSSAIGSGHPTQRSNLRSAHSKRIRQQSTDGGVYRLVVCSYWAARHHTADVGTSQLHKKSAIGVRSSSSGVIKELLFKN